MSSYNHYIEEFTVVLYKNNLWLKGKKNFFGEDYSKNYIRFTYAEDFTFNIFETEIRNAAIDSLPQITFSVELNERNPLTKSILDVNTFIGSEIENVLHENKMSNPEFIICKNKHYTNLTKVEMPTELYKNYGLHNEFELIMLNCRLYTISQFLTKKIYYGTNRLKYDLWADDDEPECSLNLCPRLTQTLNLDEEHDDSDDEGNKDDKNTHIQEVIDKLNVRVSNLNENVIELTSKLDYYDSTIRTATCFIVTILLCITFLLYK